jgi:hypothetical protein
MSIPDWPLCVLVSLSTMPNLPFCVFHERNNHNETKFGRAIKQITGNVALRPVLRSS